ncbi:MAG: dihydrolipoyllysine-residue acetyltransferase [Gammaproteobacteria bacterium]|jgi:pyruvate dehydrogenase E2 component (dihydrolipoamide acetyltransferase)|nr:dihydrolipoyllysine-residue acetyltransferase [Gammaproteobacteria bacterium]
MADIIDVKVPDIGDFSEVEVIEVLVRSGDRVREEDSLITVESDKASIEIPSSSSGTVEELRLGVGDKVSQGDVILTLSPTADRPEPEVESAPAPQPSQDTGKAKEAPSEAPPDSEPSKAAEAPTLGPRPSPTAHIDRERFRKAHASPAVRRFARELGADLGHVSGTGPKGRILKSDVQEHVKHAMVSGGGGLSVDEVPEIDFSAFGEVETRPLTRINKLTGRKLHRNWVRVPHVTQFDQADITELESFRKSLDAEYGDKGIKVTILSFLMKSLVSALKEFPHFNSSLDPTQENLILKHYYHIGVAVDTTRGLVVPIVRDADRKSLVEVAAELMQLSARAREGKLSPGDMQGGCFSISSLGGLGGTAFTPIINAPEVAILGVSRASMQAVYRDGAFVPRLILPLSLSYDHRVIDGADGVRFTTFLSSLLSDTRRMLL